MTPAQGRTLWKELLDGVDENNAHSPVLHHVLMSVLIDIVEKRMGLSDTFAITIGRRIAFIMNALEEQST